MDNLSQTTSAGNAPPEMADLTGKTLADFRLLRRLGQGGMGQVYLAEQVSLNRKVALKLLRPDFAANKTALERFKLEAKAVAQATHANIVQVYQVGEEQSLHFMALEYVEGRNLREFIARKGPPEVLLALSIMRQVAAALQRASELGIIHRDIKPENILLTKKGEVKVADFGLSRVLEGDKPAVNLTQSGVTMGTPLYMSPEQVEGKTIDFRTDIYSFGVTCYHMLAGEPPFKGGSAFEVALKHVREEAPPLPSIRPDLPTDLCAVVHKMMAKEPGERYQSCKELLKDLAVLRESLSGQTGFVALAATGFLDKGEKSGGGLPALSARTTRMPSRSRRVLLAALFLLSVVAAGAGGGVLGWKHQKDASPGDAEASSVEPGFAPENTSLDEREKEQEKHLRALIDHHLEPLNRARDPQLGARLCLDYALPLIKQPARQKEANDLFKRMEMIASPKLYHVLGALGQAFILAQQNDWRESHKILLSLRDKLHNPRLTRPAPDDERWVLTLQLINSHPDFRRALREAIQRNKINSQDVTTKDLPPLFKALLERDPPFLRSERPLPPKKPDKAKD